MSEFVAKYRNEDGVFRTGADSKGNKFATKKAAVTYLSALKGYHDRQVLDEEGTVVWSEPVEDDDE